MLWQVLASWFTIAAVVPILVGVGFSVMSMSPPDFVIAKVSFCLAAAILSLRIAWWLAMERPPQASHANTVLFATVVFAAIGGLWIASLLWVDGRRPAVPVAAATSPTDSGKPPTLLDLFKSEFPAVMKFTDSSCSIEWKNGSKITFWCQAYLDFPAKTQFLGFYIPHSSRTYDLCIRLAPSVRETLKKVRERVAITGGYGDQFNSLKDLTFSGRVLVYHEDLLTITQKAAIIKAFKKYGSDVQFRGPDYLGDQVIAWHHQHDAK